MSLADLQWCPTSVQVTVLQARGLRVKGKGGTNDAYAVMHLGKEKYQTSVVEKSIAPVWREEAAFDLPPLLLLHQGGGGGAGGAGERGTLRVHVLHRALVGPDKQLGQAVINLLQLSDDKTRSKTEWFKLLDKTGKADKDRGEVLVDIQFMRNNMTASMFDLSAAGKSRSRLGKFKDKVRGKKKESDAASGLVPSFSHVLTDSEGEAIGDEEVAVGKDEKKKKPKMKSLFSSKSNLQKNMSQSMSVLPVKNSSLSGSQSSGLNMDSSEGKKKFRFKIHKRSGSSDGKDSSSSHHKHGAAEQSNLCINGSHVYREEQQTRTSRIGSNFSLASSGHGSMEDVPESSPPSVESLQAGRQYSPWTEEEEEEDTAEVENLTEDTEEHRKDEEEITRMEEERRRRKEDEDERKQEEALERLAEQKRRQDEEERKRIEEEKVRQEEEERLRSQEEALERLAEEKRQEEERKRIEEEKVRREEEQRLRSQEEALERLAEEKRRQEEERKRIEEKVRREEELMILRKRQEQEEQVRREEQERERLAEEKKRREEQGRKRIEEEERVQEDRMRQEEEERITRQEEECRLAEEKRRMEEERMIEEEKVRKAEERRRKEEEQMRRQEVEDCEAKRKLQDQERKQQEEEERIRKEEERRRVEEERARKEKEEYERLAEERRKLGQKERERMEDEERIKREKDERMRMEEEEAERVRRKVEEKRRLEEQERRIIEEEEKRQREEGERIMKEDRARKEKEEYEKLVEEKRKLEEQERRQKEEEERIRHKEEEKIRIEEERRRREEAKKEEMERLAEEKKRLEEQEKRRIEEEGKSQREEEDRKRRLEEAGREKREEEARKLETEKLTEVQKKKENTTKDGHKAAGKKPKVAEESPAGVTCTNPFDETVSNNPFEDVPDSPAAPDSRASQVSKVKQGYPSAVSSVGSGTRSTDQKDLIGAQRDKRPAPQPPRGNIAESQREQDVSKPHQAQTNKQSNDKDVKTASVLPQRSVQVIAPLSQSRTDTKNPQGSMQSSDAKGAGGVAKNSKRPAPSRPSLEEELSSKPKSLSVSQGGGSEIKQAPIIYSSNPFEDDEDEPTAQDTPTPSSVHWPPAASEDAASQAKLKSSKMAHAPPPPPTSSTLGKQNTDGGHVTDAAGVAAPDKAAKQTRAPQPEVMISAAVQDTSLKEPEPARAQSTAEVTGVKKEGPPTTSRRLQPVKPLNPQEQKSAPVVQSEKNNNSTEIEKKREVQDKTKILSQVNDSGPKGPYTQLTQKELISLVLKQEKQLSERDKTIAELELYIDNLLVRVIEESPSILMSLNSLKKTV
ncbi:calponin homology domain-containing protein DDB_G0272472-like isoform X1 [Hippoglossus hippoglossus]|uniref:calponin homology domain-containing protein DDB_G0272472-like isoform X1 n=1 Tax=Hippoglossus hippoglossus TaxID=8267 RepID=UPI00148D7155|nr:calponin homology domain-containing protein DDB_G0272472-like isoform X1 [Hippoglossus hippoglossus]